MAEDTIVNKALDMEHKEEDIIGHIYDRAYMNEQGNRLELAELENKEDASLDAEYDDMHVVIAGVIYKNRFPSLAKEVANGEWKVSMECYFASYDVKVGDMILSRPEAEAMGLANDDSLFGKLAKIISKGKEIAEGQMVRVLRNILFSGCGVVKSPANPPSVVMETAAKKGGKANPKEVIILDYDKLEEENANNKLTLDKVEGDNPVITEDTASRNDTVGICVAYKRRVIAGEPQGPDTEVIHEDWCTLYESSCTSFGRDTTDPKCLRNQLGRTVKQYAKKLMKTRAESDKRSELTERLNKTLDKARRIDK